MASRPRTASFVALLALLAACTDTAATPTTPPDVFAPTPSIQDPSQTTAPRPTSDTLPRPADVDRASIYPVDPVTLQALPEFEPMLMKDWVWGRTSPDGTYFAATVGDDTGNNEVRLIDVTNWAQVGSWPQILESDLVVDDDGTIYFLRSLSSSTQLHTLRPGVKASEEAAGLPATFWSWAPAALINGSFVAFGSHMNETGSEQGSIVVADPSTGEMSLFDLPDVRVGSLDPANQEPWGGYLYASPAVAFDSENRRALLVHSDREVVTEVDLATGTMVHHALTGIPDPLLTELSLLVRTAELSPDGVRLYVASQRSEIVVSDDGWTFNQSPAGLMVVDTASWEIVSRLDGTVGEVHLSPNGETLLASGYSNVEDSGNYEVTSFGLYVLDAATLEILAHHPPEMSDQWYGPFSFNESAGVGYVSTWAGRPRIDVIDLTSGDVVASEEGGEYLEMLGPIGVMSKVISG